MKIKIYGTSVLSAWAALKLSKKHPVELICLKKESTGLRPMRIPRNFLTPIVIHLSRLGIPVSHLLESPAVRGWVSPSGEIFDRIWPENGIHEERWIDPVKLGESLIRACEQEGVIVQQVSKFPTPGWANFEEIGILEASSEDVAHWPKAFLSFSESTLYDVTEILFPRGMESALQKIIFFEFDGVKGVLENLNRQKSVLTLVSRSHHLINQVVDDLRTRLSERQTGNLRALFALNPQVFRRDTKSIVGPAGLYIPQFMLLDTSLGGLPVLMNTHIREGFRQVDRLCDFIEHAIVKTPVDPVTVAEDWYQEERREFEKLLRWQKGWEEWIWSRLSQSWALRVHQILPGKIRHLLRSPL